MVWATHCGSSGGCRPDLYNGDVYGGGARRLCDEMLSHREATTRDVLRVTVSHVLRGAAPSLRCLWGRASGGAREGKPCRGTRSVPIEPRRGAGSRYHPWALRLRGCCWLDVQYMEPTPSDSVVVTPATCSTLGLSHNTNGLMAATTSTAVTLMTLTTSAATTTTSLVTGAREAPRDELGECPAKTEISNIFHNIVEQLDEAQVQHSAFNSTEFLRIN